MMRILLKVFLVGWSGIKDEEGNDVPFNDDNFEALTDNHFIVKGIIEAYGQSMKGASEKN